MKFITKQSGYLSHDLGDLLLDKAFRDFKTSNEYYYSSLSVISFKDFSEHLTRLANGYVDKFYSKANSFSSDQFRDYLKDLTDLHSNAHDRLAFNESFSVEDIQDIVIKEVDYLLSSNSNSQNNIEV